MLKKQRLDILLVEKNLVTSRQLAKSYIMEGKVYVNGIKEEKAGIKIDIDSDIILKNNQMKYVSRGGYKLEKAINEFNIALENKICMDVGASTGGFTDCMLKNGALKVFSIDVGYGQFDWKLRNDERVVCMEKTNIRYVKHKDIGDYIDFASIDVSFISLTKVLATVKELLNDKGSLVCLIKPQFEAGRECIGKKGVVKDKKVHKSVIINVLEYAKSIDLALSALSYSPIKGPEGNIEYLAYLHKDCNTLIKQLDNVVDDVVNESHLVLNK